MKLYKFRALTTCKEYERIKDIIENGFYCNNFLEFNDMNEGVYTHNPDNIHITLEEKSKYYICSFSRGKALSNELMWGHYANAGKGIAIEVEVSKKYLESESIVSINYSSSKEGFKSEKDALSNKSLEWAYEDEYRYLSRDTLENNKVKIGKITKIYFGTPYENLTNYQEIKSKHKKLQKYLKYKIELENLCIKKDIQRDNYSFEHLR